MTRDEFQGREEVVEKPSLGESMLGTFQKQQEEHLTEGDADQGTRRRPALVLRVRQEALAHSQQRSGRMF